MSVAMANIHSVISSDTSLLHRLEQLMDELMNNTVPWNSENFTTQQARPEQGTLTKLQQGGEPLPWCRANTSVPITMLEESTPAEIKERIEENKGETHWDENIHTIGSLNKRGLIYYYLVAIAKGFCTIGGPVFLIVVIGLPFVYEPLVLDELIEAVLIYLIFVFLPCSLIWGSWEAATRGYISISWFMKAVRHFSFSRKTGMITRYKNDKELYSHPFAEFDCYLVSSPSHQGILSYQLHLVHRYHRYSDSIPLHNFSTSQQQEEYQRIWNMIQRYMDTSQSMPDIPELEPARSRDPVTAAYDAKTGRKPDYWFAMDDEDYKEALIELQREQQYMPTMGPEIDLFGEQKSRIA